MDKHSSLLGTFVGYRKSVPNTAPRVIFPTPHFLHHLNEDPISYCVTLHYSGKDCQGQTLQLIGHIYKLH
jgi:hypothetical protein